MTNYKDLVQNSDMRVVGCETDDLGAVTRKWRGWLSQWCNGDVDLFVRAKADLEKNNRHYICLGAPGGDCFLMRDR
jgi:hypothetical protein